MTLGHNERNRMMQERFQHSDETISRYFHQVLMPIVKFSMSIIVPPSLDSVSEHICTNPKYWPFKGSVGAIDGTHIDAYVPAFAQAPYRTNRKGQIQNVMVACSFDMQFTFVYAGWEGAANDSRILSEAVNNSTLNFSHAPPGKYYVVDAGYANTTGFLAPYRRTRYHLPDFQSSSRPRGRKELFNHAHSSLRNVIEHYFRCLKSKWPILSKMPSFSLETQTYIVVACMALHNFIKKECLADKNFEQYGNDEYFEEGPRVPDDPLEYMGSSHGQREMELIQDAIADAILVARVDNATT